MNDRGHDFHVPERSELGAAGHGHADHHSGGLADTTNRNPESHDVLASGRVLVR